jgi:predicted PurR-regulated permease PerM
VSIVAGIVDGAGKLALTASKSVFGVLVQCGVVALLTFFLLLGGPRLGASFARWCASSRTPACRVPALEESTRQVRLVARVTLLTNVLIGIAVALVLAGFAVPDAGMWGVAAGTLHFVPYAGLLLMMGLAAIEVYAAQSSLWAGLAAAGLVGTIGIVIGTAVQTWLQGRAAKVDSALLFAGTLFWAVLWGGWGLVLGPLMVVVARLVWRDRVAALAVPAAAAPASSAAATQCRKAPTPPASAPADNRQREFTAFTLPGPAPP